MRRHLASWVLVVALAAGPVAKSLDLEAISARGSLRVVAFEGEQPETIVFAAGSDRGFHGELLEGFAQLHRLKLELLRANTLQERIDQLQAGAADIIVGIIETPERRAAIDFTAEVLPVRHVVVSRRPDATIWTLKQLRVAKVGVLADSSMAKAARDSGVAAANLRTFSSAETLLAALRSREISATVLVAHNLSPYARRDPELQAGAFLGVATRSAWGVRKQDQQLKGALDAYLHNKRRSATWSRLLVKYFGESVVELFRRAQDEPPAK